MSAMAYDPQMHITYCSEHAPVFAAEVADGFGVQLHGGGCTASGLIAELLFLPSLPSK